MRILPTFKSTRQARCGFYGPKYSIPETESQRIAWNRSNWPHELNDRQINKGEQIYNLISSAEYGESIGTSQRMSSIWLPMGSENEHDSPTEEPAKNPWRTHKMHRNPSGLGKNAIDPYRIPPIRQQPFSGSRRPNNQVTSNYVKESQRILATSSLFLQSICSILIHQIIFPFCRFVSPHIFIYLSARFLLFVSFRFCFLSFLGYFPFLSIRLQRSLVSIIMPIACQVFMRSIQPPNRPTPVSSLFPSLSLSLSLFPRPHLPPILII